MTLRRDSPRPMSGALDGLRSGWTPVTVIAEVQELWPELVGAQLAGVATPIAERGGVLTVSCREAGWAHELDLMSSTLLERLNGRLRRGQVHRLRCLVGG